MPAASLPGSVEHDRLFHYAACIAGKVVGGDHVYRQSIVDQLCTAMNSTVKVLSESMSMRFPVDSPHDRWWPIILGSDMLQQGFTGGCLSEDSIMM